MATSAAPSQVQAQILWSSTLPAGGWQGAAEPPKVAAICTVIKSPEDDK